MQHFGKLLRRLRGVRSQKDVAKRLGMPQTTLSTLENQPSVPRGVVLEKLAEFYGVEVAYFYSEENLGPTQRAESWLEAIRKAKFPPSKIAAHSQQPLNPDAEKRILERIRKKYAQTSDE